MEIWDKFLNFLDSQRKVTTNSSKTMFLQNCLFVFFWLRNSDCTDTSIGDIGEWLIVTIKFSFGIYTDILRGTEVFLL
jgi:hypothetical protein